MAEIRMRLGGSPRMRYSDKVAAGMVGQALPLKGPDDEVLCEAEVLSASVTEDRRGVEVTLKVPPEVARLFPPGVAGGYSSVHPGTVAAKRPWALEL